MPGKTYKCRVLEVNWITPTVMKVSFEPEKKFDFEPGQFLSLTVPAWHKSKNKSPKRCYSFSNSPEEAKKNGYEFMVKFVENGAASTFLSLAKKGDFINIAAPFGDFQYKEPMPGRHACFISTGTGIGPFRSILLSKKFRQNRPERVLCLMGSRTQDEILCRGILEAAGIQTVYAVSQPTGRWAGFKGRVTDYLQTLPGNWAWHNTDFYLCGNGQMVQEVAEFLQGGHNVAEKNIHKEAFSLLPQRAAQIIPAPMPEKEDRSTLIRIPFLSKVA